MGAIGDDAIKAAATSSPLHAQTVDRESAYELMARKATPPAAPAPPTPEKEHDEPGFFDEALGNPAVKSFLRSTAGALGREITRGLFGTRRRR